MSILKELEELIREGIITQEAADKIQNYYKGKEASSTNRLYIAFGILGAILVGLGIILIIAHNWDDLSKGTKTFFAFLPLVIGQLFCLWALVRKRENTAWRESASAFLFFAVGACMSLISQIYNIPGNLSGFLFTWMLLCLPLIYIMNSSMVSLLYFVGTTYFACETGYWGFPKSESYQYWLLFAAALPHYYTLYNKRPQSNFTTFHNWLVPLSLVIALGTLADRTEEFMFPAYFSLFGLLYLAGELFFNIPEKPRNSGYKIIGSLGSVILLLILSFDWFWEDLRRMSFDAEEVLTSPEFLSGLILSLLAGGLLVHHLKEEGLSGIKPMAPVFLLFIIIFTFGLLTPIGAVLVNLVALAVGVLIIREGGQKDHLGILNYGLLIIAALVTCRFFDSDLSFVLRGILFVSVGVGFFATNYWMLKKRRTHEK